MSAMSPSGSKPRPVTVLRVEVAVLRTQRLLSDEIREREDDVEAWLPAGSASLALCPASRA
eukprot:695222-Hanusia_phi.AAC.1